VRPRSLILVALVVLVAAGCDAPRPTVPPEGTQAAPPDLQELPAIGGVHDVWAFEFGMDAGRETVRSHLGDPLSREQSEQSGQAGGPQIVRWVYDGLEITFLIDAAGESEYLLSVEIDGPDVPIRGGLELGMPIAAAAELLGEPRVVNERSRVYFYRNTTIELIVDRDEVAAIHLARALP
jgi:hypothetical protein